MPQLRGKVAARYLVALLCLGPAAAAPAEQIAALPLTQAAPPRLFGYREIHSANLMQFSRWTELLARWQAEREGAAESCVASEIDVAPCAPSEWTKLVARLRALPLRQQIEAANAAINAHPYVSAQRNWNDPTHWETPFEFIRRNGQCQDYAIAKFLLLREVGVTNDRMRLVVLRDVRRQVDHAVLVVELDGEILMLDNLLPHVVPAAAAADYRAYYSINETGWWLHLPNPLLPSLVVAQVANR